MYSFYKQDGEFTFVYNFSTKFKSHCQKSATKNQFLKKALFYTIADNDKTILFLKLLKAINKYTMEFLIFWKYLSSS